MVLNSTLQPVVLLTRTCPSAMKQRTRSVMSCAASSQPQKQLCLLASGSWKQHSEYCKVQQPRRSFSRYHQLSCVLLSSSCFCASAAETSTTVNAHASQCSVPVCYAVCKRSARVVSLLGFLQEDCAEKQVYIRRLEAKLEELQGAADSASKYQAAKQKVRSSNVQKRGPTSKASVPKLTCIAF